MIQWWASISTIPHRHTFILPIWDALLLLLLPTQLEYQSHEQIMVILVTTYLIDPSGKWQVLSVDLSHEHMIASLPGLHHSYHWLQYE